MRKGMLVYVHQYTLDRLQNAHLDTTDTKFDQSSKHFPSSDLVCSTANRALDQQRVVVGLSEISLYSGTPKG